MFFEGNRVFTGHQFSRFLKIKKTTMHQRTWRGWAAYGFGRDRPEIDGQYSLVDAACFLLGNMVHGLSKGEIDMGTGAQLVRSA